MPTNISVTVKGLRGVIAYAKHHGVDPADVLAHVGVSAEMIADPDGRVDRAQMSRIWDYIAARLDEPALPLRVVEFLPPGSFDVIDYMLLTAPTVGKGLEAAIAYFRLIHEQVEIRVETRDGLAHVRYRMWGEPLSALRWAGELFYICVVDRIRSEIAEAFDIIAMDFAHDTDAAPDAYEAFFGCPVRFGAPETILTVRASTLDAPLESGDPRLNSVLQRHAAQLVAALPASKDSAAQVRADLLQHMMGGDTTMEAVARRLSTSARTLQRHLAAEDTSYQDLLDQVRFQLATDLLAHDQMSVSEIGFVLGFSEPSAFHRAFRRWSGDETPGAFRERAKLSRSGAGLSTATEV